MNIVETLKSAGIIPVIVIEKEEQAVPLVALVAKLGHVLVEHAVLLTEIDYLHDYKL